MVTTLVNTFVGTSGTQTGGPIDTFPGADVPFGMVQWSPDTPSHNAGGGYEYTDRKITGFSLTHLSGPGCSVFGDFGILPATGEIPTDPANAAQPFSHANEESAPGWYAVSLGDPAIRTELSVTTRTGIGRFTFPARHKRICSSTHRRISRRHRRAPAHRRSLRDLRLGLQRLLLRNAGSLQRVLRRALRPAVSPVRYLARSAYLAWDRPPPTGPRPAAG